MALMWPQVIPAWIKNDPRRSAEVHVFERLSAQLNNKWTVFYSKPWWGISLKGGELDGEADFIIANPDKGILFVEVKGGAVSYAPATEQWTSKDRYGVTHQIKDPVGQARTCKHQYLKRLQKVPSWPTGYIRFRHGVIFPDSIAPASDVLTIAGNDRSIFCFSREFEDSLPKWIERRLSAHAHDGSQSELPPGDICIGLLRRLVADPIALRVSMRRVLQAENSQLESLLTNHQMLIISLLEEIPRAVIEGGAGTGKTLLAMEMSARLADAGKKVCLLCFNQPLSEWLKSSLANRQAVTVSTFHGLCERLVKGANLSCDKSHPDYYDGILPTLAISALEALPEHRWDAVIVDEGQDFHEGWWDVVRNMLADTNTGILRIFHDSNQSIYILPRDTALLMDAQVFTLKHNLRNTKAIARVTDHLYKGPLIQALGPEGEAPTIESASLKEASVLARNQVVKLIKDQNINKGDITVLLPGDAAVKSFRAELNQLGIGTASAGERCSDNVIIDTVRRFKGLEAKVVVLVLDYDSSNQKEIAYVAVSRAQVRLFIYGEIKGSIIADAIRTAQV